MILVAPTAFKGTLTATEAAVAMAGGVQAAGLDETVRRMPLADGGNGLIEALQAARGGRVEKVQVSGPLGRPTEARLLLRDDGVIVLESADACGLHLLADSERDPLRATTRGVGELLTAALEAAPRATSLWLGLGGSATVDGGSGMAAALGWELLDDVGLPIAPGGGELERLARIRAPARPIELPDVLTLVDVRNPLLGADGAARVFGPQKGADEAAVRRLERGLGRLAERVREDLGLDVAGLAGAGAAGGLGAGSVAFLGAELRSGSEVVLADVGYDAALARARVLVTGEGAYDAQSAMGKVVAEAVARARARGVATILVTGRLEGPAPAGARVVGGTGRQLSPDDIRAGVATALRELAG